MEIFQTKMFFTICMVMVHVDSRDHMNDTKFGNFLNLLTSVSNKDPAEIRNNRDIVRQQISQEQQAFNLMKRELEFGHRRTNLARDKRDDGRNEEPTAPGQEEPTVVPIVSLGCDSLAQIRANGAIYVDRTEMAYKIINDEDRRISIFMRPRRFGKTLLLDVFETILRHNEEDVKLLRDTYVENLAQQLPSYTVLRFNFQDLNTVKEFERRLWRYASSFGIAEELERSRETAHRDEMRKLERNKGVTVNKEDQKEEFTLFPLLIKLLKELLKKPIAVLVDEYNVVFDTTDDKATREYFFRFFRSLKDLKATGQLGFAFITGCDKVKMNIKGYTSNCGMGTTLGIDDISGKTKFEQLLGFTEDEIKKYYHELVQLKADACHKSAEEIYHQMKFQYDGYHFGDHNSPPVYNPLSVMLYLTDEKNFKGDNYWVQTVPDSPAVIERLLQDRVDLNQHLLDLDSHYTSQQLFDKEVSFPSQTSKGNDGGVEALLYRHGYLTTLKKEGEERTLRFPNNEVVGAFRKMVINALVKSRQGIELGKRAWENLDNLDMERFAESFNDFIQDRPYQQMIRIIEHDLESLHKHFMNVLMHEGRCTDCRMYRESALKNEENPRNKKRPDFIFDTVNKRIYVEFKYLSLEAEFRDDNFKQFRGYKFHACEHTHLSEEPEKVERVKILVNFDSQGIGQWYGPIKYKFMTPEEEDRQSAAEKLDNRFLHLVREFPEYKCEKCEPPLPLSGKRKYDDHMSNNIHRPCSKCGKHCETIQALANHVKACKQG